MTLFCESGELPKPEAIQIPPCYECGKAIKKPKYIMLVLADNEKLRWFCSKECRDIGQTKD